VTETIPEVEALAKAGHNGGRLPVLRDLRGSSYIRQEGNGFLIGPYEEDCIVRTDMPRGPPASFSMELFPDKLERIEENLMKGMELVPCLGDVGFKSVVNGPTIWTGDSMPRCGRSALPGWYDFNSLSYGIAQSLPLAEYLGHIMLEGEQPQAFDASDAFDPLRYGAWADDAFAVNKIKESYAHNNKIVYNYENRSAGRGELVTEKGGSSYPLHDVLAAQGARFAPFGGAGCEIPLCYVGANENDVDFHDQKRFSHFEWAKYAEAEAQHALAKVAISYSSFSKLIVTGADSKAFMENVTTGVLPSVPAKELESGKCAPGDMASRLTYCTTPLGNVCTEFTIAKLDDVGQKWYMVGSRDHVRQDLAWLSQQIPTDADVHIENMTDKICVLHLLGPDSGNLLGAVESRISGLSFMRSRQIDDFAGLKGVTATVIRVSFSGEMGYELHFPSEHGPALHTAITSNPKATSLDLKHVGSACINSMRIERGFKFRADLDLAHYKEAGIGPFLAKKRAFLGKDVEDKIPITRTSAMFQVEAEAGWEWSVIGDSPIYRKRDNKLVGYTTTSARGAATGKTVAIGYTMTDAFDQSTEAHEALELNTFGFRFPVKFLAEPLGGVNRDVWVAESAAL
jgi:dimethylglycine dehydrogenase